MGEVYRFRGIKYIIEDTLKENQREKEHIHFYDKNGNRYSAFIDRNKQCFILDENIPKRVAKAVKPILEKNFDYFVQQYDNKMAGKRVIKMKTEK